MTRTLLSLSVAVAALTLSPVARADDGCCEGKKAAAALTGTNINAEEEAGFLGVYLLPDEQGRPVVDGTFENSPAAKAGLAKGDIITGINGKAVADAEALIAVLKTLRAGQKISLQISREGWERELNTTLTTRPGAVTPATPANPATPGAKQKGFLGVSLDESSGRVAIGEVIPGSPAAKSGLKSGDVIVAVDGKQTPDLDAFGAAFGTRFAGDTVKLQLERDGWGRELKLTLGTRSDD